MRSYLAVTWHHDFASEPTELFHEIDEHRRELRKLERYRDGRTDYADESHATGTTRLSDEMVPNLDQINALPDMIARQISAAEFESMWSQTAQR